MPAPNTLQYQALAEPVHRPAGISDWLLSFADRNRVKLFVILTGIYLLGFNGQWRFEPDSASLPHTGPQRLHWRRLHLSGHPPPPRVPRTAQALRRRLHALSQRQDSATPDPDAADRLLHSGPHLPPFPSLRRSPHSRAADLWRRHQSPLLSVLFRAAQRHAVPIRCDGVPRRLRGGVLPQRPRSPRSTRESRLVRLVPAHWRVLHRRRNAPTMWALCIAAFIALVWAAIRGPHRRAAHRLRNPLRGRLHLLP